MNKGSLLSAVSLTILICGCGSDSSSDVPIVKSFEVIACPAVAAHSSITSQNVELINNPHRFVELYLASDLDSQQNEPSIDFDKRSVIAIHLGEKSSSGYQVEVTSLEESGSQIIVNYDAVSPTEGCAVDTGLTYPYCFVSMNKTSKPLEAKVSNLRKCTS